MNTTEAVKIFLLGMITAFIAVIALRPGNNGNLLAADGNAVKSGDLMAVATSRGSDAVLFLIDPATQYMGVYSLDNARFSLRAARYCKWDMAIREANQKGGIDVDEAEKQAKKSMKE